MIPMLLGFSFLYLIYYSLPLPGDFMVCNGISCLLRFVRGEYFIELPSRVATANSWLLIFFPINNVECRGATATNLTKEKLRSAVGMSTQA